MRDYESMKEEVRRFLAALKAERRRSAALLRAIKRIDKETRESWTARLVNDALAADDRRLKRMRAGR